ncbi:hypothetical protein ANCDUO_12381 [Ancylostoma duodenale]|uniref:Uncharacterized protein n=1 Tax=Ancylostoma duodenale TaxID=51022 RepID=A0A0C2GEX2_9BILA|nr:hypothetical protein ANCDUO_12381 [Ancylostoma duodenale]
MMTNNSSAVQPQLLTASPLFYMGVVNPSIDESVRLRMPGFLTSSGLTARRCFVVKASKRAGDYYMFDYDPSTDELVKPVESFVPEVTPGATKFEKLDPGQL